MSRTVVFDRNVVIQNRDKANMSNLRSVVKKFGITIEKYESLLKEQGGMCALCGSPPTAKKYRLSIDHDHSTGIVRGLLCNKCNLGLGLLGDSMESIMRVAEYLKIKGALA